MQLLTKNIKESLKIYAKEWKKEYSENLHKRARHKLDELTEKTKYLSSKLNKDVNSIDALGAVMETLEEIRREQAEIEMNYTPVQEMYALLDNYL
jgi:dynein heavy chain